MSSTNRYAGRGVSTGKEDVHRAVKNMDKGLFPQAFCKLLPDTLTGDEDAALVLHADGAGTKSIIAYLWWKETGDASVFRGIAQDAAVMNIDDMLCTGVDTPIVLSSTIGRNKALIPGEVIGEVIQGFQEFADTLQSADVPLIIGGGETADLGDLVRTICVDATCCARIKRKNVIDNAGIRAGDLIVGLSSAGKTAYEEKENSGIGSNGLTSARHDLLCHRYAEKYPETCAPETPQALLFCGPFQLSAPLPRTTMTVGEALLSPTRTYAPVMKKLFAENRRLIHGIVHNTGGAHTKCLRFGENLRFVKENLFTPPELFQQIALASGTAPREMFEVFNMGTRLELYTNGEGASMIKAVCDAFQLEQRVIGHVEKAPGKNELLISFQGETISWNRT